MSLKIQALIIVLSMALGAAIMAHFTVPTVITKDKIITKIREVKHPDGTVEKDTTIVEKKKEYADSSRLWQASLGYGTDKNYQLAISHKFLGPISLGAYGQSNGVLGAFIGVEF